MSEKLLVIILFSTGLSGQFSWANSSCRDFLEIISLNNNRVSVENVFPTLLQYAQNGRDVLTNSRQLIGYHKYGGPCSSACALNLTQGLMLLAGEEPIEGLSSFASNLYEEIPMLRRGGTTPQGLMEIFSVINRRFFPNDKFQIKSVELNLSSNQNLPNTKLVSELTIRDLAYENDKLKIVSVLIFDENDRSLSGHYMVLSRVDEGRVYMIDPNFPSEELIFEIEGDRTLILPNGEFTSPVLNPVGTSTYFNSMSASGSVKMSLTSILSVSIKD